MKIVIMEVKKMIRKKVRLGDNVVCKVTGFMGVTVSRTEYLNGCVQFEVQPRVKEDNKFIDGVDIDEDSLKIISTKRKRIIKKAYEPGGPSRPARRMKGH